MALRVVEVGLPRDARQAQKFENTDAPIAGRDLKRALRVIKVTMHTHVLSAEYTSRCAFRCVRTV